MLNSNYNRKKLGMKQQDKWIEQVFENLSCFFLVKDSTVD